MGIQYQQLTLNERYQIQIFNDIGLSDRAIAKELGRGNKTISSELNRCSTTPYCAETAHKEALVRRKQAGKTSGVTDNVKNAVLHFLTLGFTPEQIAGRSHLEKKGILLSCSSLYQLINQEGWRGLLPRKGKAYKKRSVMAGCHLIPDRVDIRERPLHVDEKKEFGHWEGDTVYAQDAYLVTLVERTTKLLLTKRVRRKSKQEVTQAVKQLLKPYRDICKSITFDNGGEFAGHKEIAEYLGCDIYFAQPYCSWQRGLNENTNGLLRRFFPKGMKIGSLDHSEIKEAEFLLNIRPRKTLGFRCPYEIIANQSVSLITGI